MFNFGNDSLRWYQFQGKTPELHHNYKVLQHEEDQAFPKMIYSLNEHGFCPVATLLALY